MTISTWTWDRTASVVKTPTRYPINQAIPSSARRLRCSNQPSSGGVSSRYGASKISGIELIKADASLGSERSNVVTENSTGSVAGNWTGATGKTFGWVTGSASGGADAGALAGRSCDSRCSKSKYARTPRFSAGRPRSPWLTTGRALECLTISTMNLGSLWHNAVLLYRPKKRQV